MAVPKRRRAGKSGGEGGGRINVSERRMFAVDPDRSDEGNVGSNGFMRSVRGKKYSRLRGC